MKSTAFNSHQMSKLSKISFRDIESETFQEVLKSNMYDLKSNVHKIAKHVRHHSNSRYDKLKEQIRRQRELSDMVTHGGQPSEFLVSAANNKDLDLIRPARKSFISFAKQLDRPSFDQAHNNGCHESRFNCFERGSLQNHSTNYRVHNTHFDKQLSRNIQPPSKHRRNTVNCVTDDDLHAMAQAIKQSKSYLNDLVKDTKKFRYPQMRNHSIDFNKATIRDGVEIKQDGLIRTSKGLKMDPIQLTLFKPQELKQAGIAMPDKMEKYRLNDREINPDQAFKKTGGYTKVSVDILFKKQLPRGNKETNFLPYHLHFMASRHQLDHKNDKQLLLDNYFDHATTRPTASTFGQLSQSMKSKQKHKHILKNRMNQLRHYFPSENQAKEGKHSNFSEIEVLSKDKKTLKNVKVEEMDFFNLLKAAGFIRDEFQDLQPRSVPK